LESEGSATNDGEINGPVAILGGHFENLNRLNTSPASMRIAAGAQVTNQENGTMEIAGGDWELPTEATLISHGLISNLATNGILSIVEGSLPMEPPTLGLAST